MDPNLPPPDDEATIRARLGDADDALRAFLHFIRLRIDGSRPGLLTRKIIAGILRTLLVPAEALLRRSLYALAALVPPLAPGTAPFRLAALPRLPRLPPLPPASPGKPRAPVFRLTEAAPRLASAAPSAHPKRPAAPRARANPERIEACFLRRLEAFERAMNDPLRDVRRLQRRLARAHRKPVRPLCPGVPPGIVNTGNAYLQFVFEQMSAFADRTIRRACDTS